MVDIADILKVRKTRDLRLRRTLDAYTTEASQLRQKREDARRAMDEYSEEIKNLEVRLLEDLLEKKISKAVIDNVYRELDRAAKHAANLSDRFEDLTKAVMAAEDNVDQAARDVQFAVQKTERLSEVKSELLRRQKDAERVVEESQNEEIAEALYRVAGQ